MKLFTINLSRKESLYLELYKSIKNAIINEELKPNEKLPSKRALSNHLGISINTVMESYNLLIDEGYIVSIPKKGYYVLNYQIPNTPYNNSTTTLDIKRYYKYDLTTKNIDLNTFPYYTWSKISRDVICNDQSIIYKSDKLGDISLRESISKYLYETKAIKTSSKNIIIGSGIEYLLTNLINALPNKRWGIENPGYDKLDKILLNNKAQVSYIPLDEYGVIPNSLDDCDCLYVTPANQFPTGIKMPLKRKLELIAWANDNKFIIEDDFDSEFKYLSNISTPLISLNPNQVIFISTFSRTICPSLRISYMILPDSILNTYTKLYSFYSQTVSTMDQKILNKFIENGSYSRHLNKTKALYNKKRALILELLKPYDYIKIKDSGYLSLNIIVDSIDITKFKNIANELSIDISVLDDYYFEIQKSNEIVLGYSGISIDDIPNAIELLIKAINKAIY